LELKIFENVMTITSMQMMRLACGLDLLESGMLKRALANSLLTLTAEVKNRTAGMLRVVGDGSYIFVISDVMVDPEFRNNGIASALVSRALDCIENMLPEGMTGTVSLFSVKGRERLYSRLGFRELPTADLGPGMQTLVIGKNHNL
jgi:GNAT superfamily N-acetyltransferase